jgi:hypothetical protein
MPVVEIRPVSMQMNQRRVGMAMVVCFNFSFCRETGVWAKIRPK